MILNYSWITVILLIAQSNWSFTAAASNQPNNLCSHTNVQALSWYAIEPKEDKKMWLIVYDSEMKKKKNQIRLEAIQNHEYRLFFKKDYVVVVVRCKEDDEGIISCGYKEFNLKALTTEERKNSANKLREYNDIGWSFEAFTTQNELDDGIDMSRIYLVDENLYLNYNYYYDLKAKKLINIHINADNHAALVAGCFDKNTYCGYDLYLNKVLQVKNDPKATIYYYDRMRFSYDNNNFYFDNFINDTCYGLRKRFAQLVPFLSPEFKEVGGSNFFKNFQEKFNHQVTSSDKCPDKTAIDEVNAEIRIGSEADYEDPASKYYMAGSGSGCAAGSYIYFVIFIISAVVAGLLTIAFIAVVIAVFIARKKMDPPGKNLPKKAWETQTTEDATSYMDQTVGVTEATTVGGETSAYSTIG